MDESAVVTISIPEEWFNYLSAIRAALDPDGTSTLTILKRRRALQEQLTTFPSGVRREFEISKAYAKPFLYLEALLSRLEANEKVVVIPKNGRSACLFCGSDEMSDEHIFPKWLRPYFDEKPLDTTLYSRSDEDDLLSTLKSGVSRGVETSYGYTTRNVCVNCNTGWMSVLEENVKSILTADGPELRSRIDDLHLDEQLAQVLASWVTVKALLLAHKSELHPVIPAATYKYVKRGTIPNGFLVEMADCDAYELNFVVNKGASAFGSLLRLKEMNAESAKPLVASFFMVCLHLGNFLFRVSYFDESNGLKREGCIRPTVALFPFGLVLPFKTIENEQEKWDAVEPSLKLPIFSMGISLTDF